MLNNQNPNKTVEFNGTSYFMENICLKDTDIQIKDILINEDGEYWIEQQQISNILNVKRQSLEKNINERIKDKSIEKNDVQLIPKNTIKGIRKKVHLSSKAFRHVVYKTRSEKAKEILTWFDNHIDNIVKKGISVEPEILKNSFEGTTFLVKQLEHIRGTYHGQHVLLGEMVKKHCIDYNPSDEQTILFFKKFQNLVYFYICNKNKTQIILERATTMKEKNYGITSTVLTDYSKKGICKILDNGRNYLTTEEFENAYDFVGVLNAKLNAVFKKTKKQFTLKEIYEYAIKVASFMLEQQVSIKPSNSKLAKIRIKDVNQQYIIDKNQSQT